MEELKSSSHVKVHSVLTVVSSRPIGPGKVHKFTDLDRSMGFHTVHEIFYYKSNPFKDGLMAQDLDNLRISLAELLYMYPPVTGRLTRGSEDGNWEIKCNDAGVRMLRAKVDITLDEWLRSADADEERDLTVWDDMPDDPYIWSPFRIQINDFECGGLAIGISCPHMHADLTTVTQLVKSWTQVHRGKPVSNPPIFSLPSSFPTNQSSSQTNSYATKFKSQTTSVKMSTSTFKFSDSMIKKYLYQVQEICPEATPFDVLTALFWSRIAQLKEPKHEQNYSLTICLDLRNLRNRNKPIPFGYFGNALIFSELSVNAEELGSERLSNAAKLVHQHVEGIEEEEVWSSTKDWFESFKQDGKYPFRMYGPELCCLSMEQMILNQSSTDESSMYDAMFKKDEKSIHVSYHIGNVEGEGLILIMPTREGGLGRTVVVRLPEERVAALREDQAILELEPVVLFSGKK